MSSTVTDRDAGHAREPAGLSRPREGERNDEGAEDGADDQPQQRAQ